MKKNAADCTAFAYANLHEEFMKGRVTIIGCPKLDAIDYTEKLADIIMHNDIREVTVVRMEVPCCGGLQRAAVNALQASGKDIPLQVVTISRDGKKVEQATDFCSVHLGRKHKKPYAKSRPCVYNSKAKVIGIIDVIQCEQYSAFFIMTFVQS